MFKVFLLFAYFKLVLIALDTFSIVGAASKLFFWVLFSDELGRVAALLVKLFWPSNTYGKEPIFSRTQWYRIIVLSGINALSENFCFIVYNLNYNLKNSTLLVSDC